MAISFPRTDIMSATAFSDQTFPLMSRQELSRTASGVTYGKDLGSALWAPGYTTIPMYNDDALAYEAALNSLDGVIGTFEARDLRRAFPKAHPNGSGANDGVLLSVNANNKELSLSGLVAGQIISVGDYLSFDYGDSRALHQVMAGTVADEAGETAEFEVRPHIRPGWVLDPETVVVLKEPAGLFRLMPNSLSSQLQDGLFSVIKFQAVQAI